MVAVCKSCGSVDIQLDQPADDGLIAPNHYWAVLFRISNQIPNQAHCDTWLDENGYSDEMALRVARAMDNVLWYDEDRLAWYTLKMNGTKEVRTYYKKIILTFYNWMVRENQGLSDLRQNGRKPGTSMKVKEGGRY